MSEQGFVVAGGGMARRAQPSAVVRLPEQRAGPQNITRLPETVNLIIYMGDTLMFALVVLDAAGEPPDLSGATVRAQIRAAPGAHDIAGEFAIGVSENIIELYLAAEVSALLPARGVWDCELDLDGVVTTLVAGTVMVTADVTR